MKSIDGCFEFVIPLTFHLNFLAQRQNLTISCGIEPSRYSDMLNAICEEKNKKIQVLTQKEWRLYHNYPMEIKGVFGIESNMFFSP